MKTLKLEQPGRIGVSLIPILLGAFLLVAASGVLPGKVDRPICSIIGAVLVPLGLLLMLFRDTLEIRLDGSWRRTRGFAFYPTTTYGSSVDVKAVSWRMRQGPDPDSNRPRKHYSIVIEFHQGVEFIVTPHPALSQALGLSQYPPLDEVVSAISERFVPGASSVTSDLSTTFQEVAS